MGGVGDLADIQQGLGHLRLEEEGVDPGFQADDEGRDIGRAHQDPKDGHFSGVFL